MSDSLETLTLARHGNVAVIALNRPEAMNALNLRLREEMRQVLDELKRDAGVGAVVLTGAGARAFSAGMDLKEFARLNADVPISEMRRLRWERPDALATFDKPLIAAVNGLAIGGGVELALLCDLIVAADSASFAFAEIKRGLIPGNGGTQRLARRVGQARALELILTGRTVPAAEALVLGLAEYVVPAAGLMEKALALATTIADNAPVAVRTAKAAILRGMDLPLEEGLRLEGDLAAFLYTTEDAKEGPAAFLEKRAPVWRGR